jgi:hypothetical protein
MTKKIPTLLAAALLSGCATVSIPLPAELASLQKLPVSGRQGWMPGRDVRFGDYRTERVRRSATEIDEYPGLLTSRGEHAQYYSFRLREGEAPAARVGCAAEATARATRVPVLGGQVTGVSASQLECRLSPQDAAGDEGDEWTLSLASRGGSPMSGTLTGDGAELEIEGTRAMEGGASQLDATGYYLRRDGRTLAAVEVVDGGGVWMDPSLPDEDRLQVAGAAMALLLYESLGEDFEAEEQ